MEFPTMAKKTTPATPDDIGKGIDQDVDASGVHEAALSGSGDRTDEEHIQNATATSAEVGAASSETVDQPVPQAEEKPTPNEEAGEPASYTQGDLAAARARLKQVRGLTDEVVLSMNDSNVFGALKAYDDEQEKINESMKNDRAPAPAPYGGGNGYARGKRPADKAEQPAR